VSLLAERLDSYERLPAANTWFHHLVGVVYGALVMGPYAGLRLRIWRILAMCVASGVIYHLAVNFVTDRPLGYDTIAPFVFSGSGVALLTSLTVVALAPQPSSWTLILLTFVADAAGGAVFELRFEFDEMMLAGHAAWHVLVCLALHFGFRSAET